MIMVDRWTHRLVNAQVEKLFGTARGSVGRIDRVARTHAYARVIPPLGRVPAVPEARPMRAGRELSAAKDGTEVPSKSASIR